MCVRYISLLAIYILFGTDYIHHLLLLLLSPHLHVGGLPVPLPPVVALEGGRVSRHLCYDWTDTVLTTDRGKPPRRSIQYTPCHARDQYQILTTKFTPFSHHWTILEYDVDDGDNIVRDRAAPKHKNYF